MTKSKDITGKRFNNLTAISVAGKDNFGRNKWKFICDCGKETIASLNNVQTGITKSCGCLKHKPHRRIDLVGQTFGRLKVVSYAATKNGRAYWNCLCECGNKIEVSYLKLSRGKTKSCGCLQKECRAGLTRNKNPNNYAKWARDLKKIYGYCAKCGSDETLHAHHINPYGRFPQQRKDYTNGVVLCEACHKDFHNKYGNQKIGVKEIGEYLNMDLLSVKVLELVNGYRIKNGAEDIKKAIHYCQLLLELEYQEK